MENRRYIVTAALAALAAAAVCACHHCPPPPAPEPPPIVITIGDDCNIAGAPTLQRGDRVQISYFGPCDWIDIDFGGTDLFGCAGIRLKHGERATFTVNSPPTPPAISYALDLDCSCEGGGGHTTPEIKVGPPPPPGP